MSKTKKEKQILLDLYKKEINDAKGLVVLKPFKLRPNESNNFRKEIYDFQSTLNIVKNSIFKIALKETKLPAIEDLEKGEHAVMFIKEDIINPSKALKKFIENTKTKEGDSKVVIVSGILDGQLLTKEQISELADMPTIQGSISQILGVLDNALSSVINVLEDPIRSYISIIDQKYVETK